MVRGILTKIMYLLTLAVFLSKRKSRNSTPNKQKNTEQHRADSNVLPALTALTAAMQTASKMPRPRSQGQAKAKARAKAALALAPLAEASPFGAR